MTHIPFGSKFGYWWILISKLDGYREAYFESQLRSLRTEMCLVSSLSQGWADSLWLNLLPNSPSLVFIWFFTNDTNDFPQVVCFFFLNELSWTFTLFFFQIRKSTFPTYRKFSTQNPFRVHFCIFPKFSNQIYPPNVRWFLPGILSSKSWSLPPAVRKAPASKAFASGVGNRWNLGLGSCWIPFWVYPPGT